MRRHLIGIIALLMLLGVVYFRICPPEEASTWAKQLEAACSRGGALAAVIWLAYVEIHRLPAWIWGLLLAVLVVVAIRPRTALLAIPMIVVLAILRPRIGRKR